MRAKSGNRRRRRHRPTVAERFLEEGTRLEVVDRVPADFPEATARAVVGDGREWDTHRRAAAAARQTFAGRTRW